MKKIKSLGAKGTMFVFVILYIATSCEINTNFYRYYPEAKANKKTDPEKEAQQKNWNDSTNSNMKPNESK